MQLNKNVLKIKKVLGAKDQLNKREQKPEKPVEDFVMDMQLKSYSYRFVGAITYAVHFIFQSKYILTSKIRIMCCYRSTLGKVL